MSDHADIVQLLACNPEADLAAIRAIAAPFDRGGKLDSLIGDVRFEKKIILTGWRRALFPLARAAFKFYEMVAKRATSSRSWLRDRALGKRLKQSEK